YLANKVVECALGDNHTLFLTNEGQVYSCGNNDYGQLGHDQPRKRPQPVTGLDAYNIVRVACGATHSTALNQWGQVFSWGSDYHGQLGQHSCLSACHSVGLWTKTHYTVALTNNGDILAWGANNFGQLGIGLFSSSETTPKLVASLRGIPIVFITCGANHTFAISKSGAVYGWGQLGVNDTENKMFPTQLRTMRNLRVRYIACGEEFSAFLTLDGGVFTCGAGMYGQLGHGSNSNEILPRQVIELMGSTITQVGCGRQHCLALVPSRGRVYSFGIGGSGQLGVRKTNSAYTPQAVLGPWVSPGGSSLIPSDNENGPNLVIRRLFAGYEHTDDRAGGCDLKMLITKLKFDSTIFTGITDYILNELTPNPPDVESLRVYLILPLYHEFNNTKQYAKLQKPFATQVLRLKQPANKVVGGWWSMMTADYFEKLINIFKNVASHILRNQNIPQGRTVFYDSALVAMLDIMVFLNKLNHNIDGLKVPYDIFHMNELHDYLDVRFDYVLWLSDNDSGKLYLCNYPFLFDAHAKLKLLETDQSLQMQNAMQNAAQQAAFAALFSPTQMVALNQFLVLNIFTGITDYILNELTPNPPDVESLRVYLILPLYHEFNNTKQYAKLQKPFATQVLRLKQPANKVVREWWSMMTADYFEKLINIFKNVASHILRNQNIPQGRTVFYDSALVAMLDIMVFLNKLNHNIDGLKVPYDIFHMNELHDYLDVRFDYVLWLSDNDSGKLYLCNYPFLFDAHAKLKLLETDQSLQMQNAMQNAAQQAAFAALFSPTQMVALNQFLVLNVTRDHIIEDTLRELRAVNPSDLKKPLKPMHVHT
ncbi:hypothetical protein YQE_09366, partial [Dendroctonus ponderosae]